MQTYMQCGRYQLDIAATSRPLVMGILNVTPDSFYDGGRYHVLDAALAHAEAMIAAGVDIIDIGGESTRPGSQPMVLDEELARVIPVIYALRDCGIPLSVDTAKPEVMREAIFAGADMINDINAFQAIGAIEAVAESNCGLCVMHMQNDPASMQVQPQYSDVFTEVAEFLRVRIGALRQSGVAANRLCIDPGFGFGKTLAHNISLLTKIKHFQEAFDLPVLAGVSRKSMIGAMTDQPTERRMAGSLAGAIFAVARGARIVRVHDVAETVDALKVWYTLSSQ